MFHSSVGHIRRFLGSPWLIDESLVSHRSADALGLAFGLGWWEWMAYFPMYLASLSFLPWVSSSRLPTEQKLGMKEREQTHVLTTFC